MTSVPRICQKYIARVSFAAPSFSRSPPGQAMAVSRGSYRGRVLWRPHMPHPMLAMLSHAISCTPIPPWSSSKCPHTPSTNQLHVFALQVGSSVWLNKDYCLNTSSSSKFFRQGGNAWNLFDFDNQSAAIFSYRCHKILFHSKRSKRFTGSYEGVS